ncbi:hypothetical protein [Spirosoma endophyticum]|uniref:Uncharacterized protein n=1 Tax=Spirosoma endophyticum TaxID=662367 RepID=A0A1I2GWQ9_9BACT|nr:hypothetical protein [Spirosoma endophyticum]SFF21678.1 hypothetical protein SAMN05216167_1364 [Spirosoma endophyticum]
MKDAIVNWILSENECIQQVNFRSNLLDLSACYARLLQHLNTLIHFYDEVNRYKVAYTMVSILDTAGLEKLELTAHKAGSSELAKKNYLLSLELLQYTISQAVLLCQEGDRA